jgi:hypothetical protein
VAQVRLPVIPEECRIHHPWDPGLLWIDWEPFDCPPAQAARGGHIVVRCLGQIVIGQCLEKWMAPMHQHVPKDLLGHHRPGNR